MNERMEKRGTVKSERGTVRVRMVGDTKKKKGNDTGKKERKLYSGWGCPNKKMAPLCSLSGQTALGRGKILYEDSSSMVLAQQAAMATARFRSRSSTRSTALSSPWLTIFVVYILLFLDMSPGIQKSDGLAPLRSACSSFLLD